MSPRRRARPTVGELDDHGAAHELRRRPQSAVPPVPVGEAVPAVDGDEHLVLDDLFDKLEQFRMLRRVGDEAATEEMLDELGAHDPVEQQIVLELSASRVLGYPERFEEASALAMHALEVLDRNGARAPGVPRLGPLTPLARFLVQLVVRFIVRNHQGDVVDAVRNLYGRRLAWCRPSDPARPLLLRARQNAERVATAYKGNPIGVPTFLLGGAAVSSVAQGLRVVVGSAVGSRLAAVVTIVGVFSVLGVLSWAILRGAAIARHRIRLTVQEPLEALWETVGRCGQPPRDDARTFAVYAIVLTVVGWVVIPAGVLFILTAF